MPLYEYQCDACGNQFELIRKFSDPPLETCPKCGVAGKIRKLVSSPAFQFKGSGWYATDYAKKSGDSGGAGKSADDKAGSKTETKTETKTDTAAKDTASPAADKPAAAPATTSSTKDKS